MAQTRNTVQNGGDLGIRKPIPNTGRAKKIKWRPGSLPIFHSVRKNSIYKFSIHFLRIKIAVVSLAQKFTVKSYGEIANWICISAE